jgi:hypothetical protein
MPPVVFANGDQNTCRLARLQDDDDLVRLRPPDVTVDEVITASRRSAVVGESSCST